MVRFLYTPFYNLVVLKEKKKLQTPEVDYVSGKKKNHSQLWWSASYNMYRKRQSFQFIHLFHLRAQSVEIIFKNVTRDSLGIVFWTEAGIFKLGSQNLHNNFTEVYSKVEFWNKTLGKLLPLSDIPSPCPVSVLFVQEAHFPLNPYSCSHLSPAFCAAVAGWRVEGGCCVSRNNERRHISRQQQSRLWLAGGS